MRALNVSAEGIVTGTDSGVGISYGGVVKTDTAGGVEIRSEAVDGTVLAAVEIGAGDVDTYVEIPVPGNNGVAFGKDGLYLNHTGAPGSIFAVIYTQ